MRSIWQDQWEFNRDFLKKFKNLDIDKLTPSQVKDLVKEHVLSIHSEADEVLREFSWKTHRREKKDIIMSNVYEEIIDVFKFLMGAAHFVGMDYDTFCETYWKKTSIVKQRLHQEYELDLLANENKIAAIDIDGVLAKFPEPFIEFTNKELNTKFTDFEDLETTLDYLTYENLKDRYRQSGIKANLPLTKNAVEFTNELRKRGYKIVMLSARPVEIYKRIYSDTLEWLNKNKIAYDAVMFDKEKHIKIVREFPNLKFIVEDNRHNANKVARLNCKAFLLDNTYNQGKTHPNVTRVKSLAEILNAI